MEKLKDFMLLFRMEMHPNVKRSEDELINVKNAWAEWLEGIARQARLVSSHQLGLEGKTLTAQNGLHPNITHDARLAISGNLVLKAVSLEEAAQIARDCPILSVGGSVEIRSTLTTY